MSWTYCAAVVLLAWSLCAPLRAHAGAAAESPAVTTPPEAFFEKVRRPHRPAARDFYRKHLDINGLPVVASAAVADAALHRTHEIVSHMLAGRPDIIEALVERDMYLTIIGAEEVYTDLPENRNARNPEYLNERVRGTGGFPTSFGEENLLSLPIDRYDDESIAVHEFSHTIDSTLGRIDPTWEERKRAAYRNAVDKGLYKDTYAIGNAAEYWAEMVQAYFDCNRVNNWNHGPIGRREPLKMYDPQGYALVRETFNLGPNQDWHYRPLRPRPCVTKPPARFGIDPYYTKFTWAREFVVVGRDADDDALLKANDIIRKMFAYRHDILKALIADGLKLVVLGPNEGLADLPEFKKTEADVDHTARFLDYTPGVKILVVGQENLSGSPDHAGATECQVIRVLARALYHVTGRRPIDPDWDGRRDMQQYELRVQRMDVRFDEKLRKAYAAALDAGLWRGTAAAHDPVEYWSAGVLAYFDATGQGVPPHDAARPITTREALRAYDAALFALVDETMGYHGKVDWRLDQRRR